MIHRRAAALQAARWLKSSYSSSSRIFQPSTKPGASSGSVASSGDLAKRLVLGLGLAGAGFAAGSYIRDNKRQRHDSALEPVPHAGDSKHKRAQQQQQN
eukprot:10923-Heterococcus_DN1.PRE.1